MSTVDPELLKLMVEEREARLARIQEQPSKRTSNCPSIGRYSRYAREGWPATVRLHASSCDFCQNRLAGAWAIECPSDTVLRNYLRDDTFPDKKAVDRHLHWQGCQTCSARLKDLADVWDYGTERSHPDIPAEIWAAGRLLAHSASAFFSSLLGFSREPEPTPAAAGALVLSAELDRYRGGTLLVELDARGRGVLHARFDYPDEVFISLYDTQQAKLVLLTSDDAESVPRILVPAGVSESHFWAHLSHQDLQALRIIIQHRENQ